MAEPKSPTLRKNKSVSESLQPPFLNKIKTKPLTPIKITPSVKKAPETSKKTLQPKQKPPKV